MSGKRMSKCAARIEVRRHFAEYIWHSEPPDQVAPEVAEIWTDECHRIAARLDPSPSGERV